ncbi:MAG: OB-fold nucleic acid binding domain-containing protein, partial [Solirubrobacterales bacterium]
GKADPSAVFYEDERLREITEATYGCLVYQEQLMAIAVRIAGFDPARADDLRKAIGKKLRDKMEELRDEFMEGAAASGTDRAVADRLWKTMESAADYSFNKSHAASYAMIAYRTAWLKANYPAEFMAAVISSVMDTKDKVPRFIGRCTEMGIAVLPPDINQSDHGFVVTDEGIRFGLDAVKNVGHAAVEAIIAAREERDFDSLWDVCERVDARAVNKKALECLVMCGALDSLPGSRKGMLEVLPEAQASGSRVQADSVAGQGSFFDMEEGGEDFGGSAAHPAITEQEFEESDLLALEKETLGTYLSAHPLDGLREALAVEADCPISELPDRRDDEWVTVGGLVTEYRKVRTRSGRQIAFATLSDVEAEVELLVFNPDESGKTEAIQPDSVVLVKGRVDHTDRGTKLVVQGANRFEPDPDQVAEAKTRIEERSEPLTLRVDEDRFSADALEDVKALLEHHRGDIDVNLLVVGPSRQTKLRLGPDYRVVRSAALMAELDEILGPQEELTRAA